MTTDCGTHSGSFHADDVLAFALIRAFRNPDARVVRTRDLQRLAECDVVFDVGGEYDPDRCRFDHHQQGYEGDLSSAGMVLNWLEAEGNLDAELAQVLRDEIVDYVDAVDNGRRSPDHGVPCFTSVVGMMSNGSDDGFDERYLIAADFATRTVEGIREGVMAVRRARAIVAQAMDDAVSSQRRVLFFDEFVSWKRAYFENGGEEHPTDFVMFPTPDSYRVVAIPPEPGSFAQKVSFPAEWAGLVDAELEEAIGVKGAKFCHKNRFIAVFTDRDAAMAAMRKWDLGDVDGQP